MDQEKCNRPQSDQQMEQIAFALDTGIILLDATGQIVWMDKSTRDRINGDLQTPHAQAQLAMGDGICCFVSSADVVIGGERKALCVIRQAGEQIPNARDLVAAIEAVMADSSWFTHAMTEKLKVWLQTSRPALKGSDLDLLTGREREILALICEGRSDAEMSSVLDLSQNTIRNHVASLYRKIGVNRRSAAIIWARERALTTKEVLASLRRARPSHRDEHRRPY